MAQVFLPDGRSLRLRLFPQPKAKANARASVSQATPGLFAPPDEDAVVAAAAEAMAAKVVGLMLLNRSNAAILERLPKLGLRDWWLTGGCIVQTVWNLRTGRPADEGVRDYDLFYFSEDLSEEAERQVQFDAHRLLPDLSVPLQIKNQARVHLWYPEKYGIAYSALTSASEGIMRFVSTTNAVGIKRTGDDHLDVFMPYGLSNVWDMVMKPNRLLPLANIYAEKAARWQKQWPKLIVRPWVVENDD
jgi:hypothetical protein